MSTSRASQRGAVLPSPVVILSIVAVALAAVTFVLTRGSGPKEREIGTVADGHSASAPASPSASGSPSVSASPKPKPHKKKRPVVHRDQVGVVVFNDTSITGLAGSVGQKVASLGWHFVAADNWVGTVPATTVYFPHGMRPAGRQLALDLGIQRIMPADVASNMSSTDLTVILTGPLS